MSIDFSALCFVVFTALFIVFYFKIAVKCKAENVFLLDLKWREQLSLSDIHDESVDYWMQVSEQSDIEQQQRYCSGRAFEAARAAIEMKAKEERAFEEQKQAEKQKGLHLPDNVIKMV